MQESLFRKTSRLVDKTCKKTDKGKTVRVSLGQMPRTEYRGQHRERVSKEPEVLNIKIIFTTGFHLALKKSNYSVFNKFSFSFIRRLLEKSLSNAF